MFKANVTHDCYEFSLLIFAQSGESKIYSVFYMLRAFFFILKPSTFSYTSIVAPALQRIHIYSLSVRETWLALITMCLGKIMIILLEYFWFN